MAYSPIEESYMNGFVATQFETPVEPEPMQLADSGQVKSDAQAGYGSIGTIPRNKAQEALGYVGELLSKAGVELDKVGLDIPALGRITLKDLTVGESGKVLEDMSYGFMPVEGAGGFISGTTRIKPDAALELLNIAPTVGAAAKIAGKSAIKGVVKAVESTKGLPVGNSIKMMDGTEITLPKAPKIESKAFKSWFGESKAVDDTGTPIVVYHARRNDFEAFDPDRAEGKSKGTGTFFSSSPDVAATYNSSSEHNIVPAYLSLKNPVIVDGGGANWNKIAGDAKVYLPSIKQSAKEDEILLSELTGSKPDLNATRTLKEQDSSVKDVFKGNLSVFNETATTDDIARWARSQGYDGVIFKNVVDHGPAGRFSTDKAFEPSNIYVAFEPQQIKSVMNKGTFDPKDPRMLHGGAAVTGAGASQQEESK